MMIRAITIFVTNYSKINEYTEKLSKLNDDNIWSKRISLPPTPSDLSLSKLIELLPTSHNEIIFSLVNLQEKDKRLGEIKDILKSDNRIYAHVLVKSTDKLKDLAKLNISLEPEEASRFALLFNQDFLLTPYFPTSSANTIYDSFGLSLLYVNEFKQGKINEALSKADTIGRQLEKKLGIKYLGIDASLSPWMESSVGEIIENRSRKIFDISNLSIIAEINREIFEGVWRNRVNPIGFSELMLPVAEDNLLKERAKEGSITLKDLLLMSYVCVAGIDMVGIYSDLVTYENILKSIYYIQYTKRKPYGVRMIPTNGSPVLTKMFGEIPEVKVV
ncbi:MAG: DUF711 family protein [Saccharolobus sp.]|uniref:DUF711 family protein n=2 Tax=Saccharolobus shibatae TaxID=2286 RepID=A0A8F5GYC5_9CREN|nr:DUF711 family protein [Saccharolobus shibatae]MCH4814537.1 DUF711 family protein [Saccharolobus shibatae]QXJ30188.1 Uncharacterized protein J5U23_03083 [Saccharolobus shibatae B12]QXJ33377.1 Uncharacterized protein J5U21_03054 [Saccharolobus shibatae]QXJ36491.1 Uncharacterized protein J5U22_03064 [Saccharolobus shibatae]